MFSDCYYCKNYKSYMICNKREQVEHALAEEGEMVEMVDWWLEGKKRVKEIENGKKVVNCPCYKFDIKSEGER